MVHNDPSITLFYLTAIFLFNNVVLIPHKVFPSLQKNRVKS